MNSNDRLLLVSAQKSVSPVVVINKMNTQGLKSTQMESSSQIASSSSSSSSSSNQSSSSPKITGIPCVASPSRYTAPVHIDVGGMIYTSSLETLTRYGYINDVACLSSHNCLIFCLNCLMVFESRVSLPNTLFLDRHSESRLAKMFNGSIPIVLDSLKQHYFIDRDGKMFRHILNFLRTSNLVIPDNFEEIDLLYEEAKYYDLQSFMKLLEEFKMKKGFISSSSSSSSKKPTSSSNGQHQNIVSIRSNNNSSLMSNFKFRQSDSNHSLKRIRATKSTEEEDDDDERRDPSFECLALHICPDLGERLMLSGERILIEEVFPEISETLMDARSGVAWNQDAKHVIRFPLNGYCKLLSLEAISRLLSHDFVIYASNGGGVEGQQFSEYLFVRKC